MVGRVLQERAVQPQPDPAGHIFNARAGVQVIYDVWPVQTPEHLKLLNR